MIFKLLSTLSIIEAPYQSLVIFLARAIPRQNAKYSKIDGKRIIEAFDLGEPLQDKAIALGVQLGTARRWIKLYIETEQEVGKPRKGTRPKNKQMMI